MKKYIVMILICVMTLCLTACDSLISKPEDTLYRYEEAINNYDISGAIECFEPSVQKIYAGGMEIGSSLFGMDMGTMVDAVGGLADIFGDELVEGGMPKIYFEVNSKERIDKNTAILNVTYTFEGADEYLAEYGDETSGEMDVLMVRIDGKWYISAESEMPGMY